MDASSSIIDRIVASGAQSIHEIDIDALINGLDQDTIDAMASYIEADEDYRRFNKKKLLFPDTGPLRRELYTKHMEFFRVGAQYPERTFMAGNRVGKTVAGGYETECHLTGDYPDWWEGHRFRARSRVWVAGDTNETTRDILQLELLGEIGFRGNRKMPDGSGLIPRDAIGDVTWKSGVPNLIDTVTIKHKCGNQSLLGFKSYDQGRRVFQGTAKELIWLDEEGPEDVYGECLMRTATTRGLIMCTYTPLNGLSELVLSFLPQEMRPGGE